MKERAEVKELAGRSELVCTEYRDEVSEGVLITPFVTRIRLKSVPEGGAQLDRSIPTVILFDSLDGRVHSNPKTVRDLNYFEYAGIRLDGAVTVSGARTSKTEALRRQAGATGAGDGAYSLSIAKARDHVRVDIDDGEGITRVTVALPDSTRYAYAALTGERCRLKDVAIEKTGEKLDPADVRRIAPLVSYIDAPEGDLPNVQVDGFRSAATRGVPVEGRLRLRFHTMSLPTARLIWHCPFVSVFTSADGSIGGAGFREYALVRLDGETWEDKDDGIVNRLIVNRQSDFMGWDAWKEANKKGFDCTVCFERQGDRLVLTTENLGVSIRNTTFVEADRPVYVALTGDQCALTDIRIG